MFNNIPFTLTSEIEEQIWHPLFSFENFLLEFYNKTHLRFSPHLPTHERILYDHFSVFTNFHHNIIVFLGIDGLPERESFSVYYLPPLKLITQPTVFERFIIISKSSFDNFVRFRRIFTQFSTKHYVHTLIINFKQHFRTNLTNMIGTCIILN